MLFVARSFSENAGHVLIFRSYSISSFRGKVEDPIIKRSIGRKQTQIVYSRDGSDKRTKTILTPDADVKKPCFSDEDAKTIAEWCVKIEDHYSKHHGHPTPMDIEWAKDGITGELFIVQARPETVRSGQKANLLKQTQVTAHQPPIIQGNAIGSDAATGKARVIKDVSQISSIKPGEILVADMTDPDWVPGLRIASGVVTNRGGRTCHAAIVSRELGVPCIVGTKDATEKLKTGEEYTIDCSQGSTGKFATEKTGACSFQSTQSTNCHICSISRRICVPWNC